MGKLITIPEIETRKLGDTKLRNVTDVEKARIEEKKGKAIENTKKLKKQKDKCGISKRVYNATKEKIRRITRFNKTHKEVSCLGLKDIEKIITKPLEDYANRKLSVEERKRKINVRGSISKLYTIKQWSTSVSTYKLKQYKEHLYIKLLILYPNIRGLTKINSVPCKTKSLIIKFNKCLHVNYIRPKIMKNFFGLSNKICKLLKLKTRVPQIPYKYKNLMLSELKRLRRDLGRSPIETISKNDDKNTLDIKSLINTVEGLLKQEQFESLKIKESISIINSLLGNGNLQLQDKRVKLLQLLSHLELKPESCSKDLLSEISKMLKRYSEPSNLILEERKLIETTITEFAEQFHLPEEINNNFFILTIQCLLTKYARIPNFNLKFSDTDMQQLIMTVPTNVESNNKNSTETTKDEQKTKSNFIILTILTSAVITIILIYLIIRASMLRLINPLPVDLHYVTTQVNDEINCQETNAQADQRGKTGIESRT